MNHERQRIREREPARVRSRSRRLRRVFAVALGLAASLAALLGLSYGPAVRVRDRLSAAKTAMETGRDALLRGDAKTAASAFSVAERTFIQAGADARTPALRVFGWLPVAGATPDAVVALADAGRLTAQAGTDVANALRSLPGGTDALAPHDGAFDATALRPLAKVAGSAADRVASALDLLRSAPASGLLGPVAAARAAALTELLTLEHSLRSGSDLLRALPQFLGSNRTQRYFFGAVTPAELRGNGGFMGAYSILTVDAGSMRFSSFQDTRTLPNAAVGTIEPPSADYARNYDRFGGAGFWRNINMTPNFPSAALAIERLYERGTDQKIDGVILADPFALQALLGTTGPVDVPAIGRTLRADDVVAFTANQAYSELDQVNRKTLLGAAAAAVFEAFMHGGGSPIEGARAVVRSVSEGHLSVYSDDPRMQRALVDVDAAGAFTAPPGDFLSLVQNNAAGNKVDYYLTRRIDHSIELGADGTGVATVHVRLRNDAPLTGAPPEVLGPYGNASARGENVSYTTLYCSKTCQLQSAQLDGMTEPQQIGSERGFTSLQDYIHVASRTRASLQYRLEVGRAWFGDATRGIYRLTFLNQATIRPTQLTVDVQLPSGMAFSSSNIPVRVRGSNVSWQGVPQRRLVIEVRFQRPWPQRMIQGIMEFLTKPVFPIR